MFPGIFGGPYLPSLYEIRCTAGPSLEDDDWAGATTLSGAPDPRRGGAPGFAQKETAVVSGFPGGSSGIFLVGVRCYSNDLMFWTSVSNVISVSVDSMAPSAVGDLKVVPAGHGQYTLTWTTPGDDGLSGLASTFDIRAWDPTSGDFDRGSPLLPSPPAPGPSGTQQTWTVSVALQ